MDGMQLRKYIGGKIKEYRKKGGITQEQLGEKLGVKNNTISAYERGIISPDSDTIFLIANILDVTADDLFPPAGTNSIGYLDKAKDLRKENLGVKDMSFFQELIEKTLTLKGDERERFLESIKFTVEFYDRGKKD